MKFGVTIKTALHEEWSKYYVDYSKLKKFIKIKLKSKSKNDESWNESDEKNFVKILDFELQKVANFQEQKISDLHERISLYEQEVKDLIESQSNHSSSSQSTSNLNHQPSHDSEENQDETLINPSSSSDEDFNEEIQEHFNTLEFELTHIIADVHDLGHFSHLNYTAFIKIIKKHDKKTGWQLRREFIQHHLETRPFYKENYEALVVQLSRLYNLVRTRGNPPVGDSAAGGGQSAFVRQTTKYWVHRDNFVALKLFVLRHLPVLVFNPNKPFEPSDSAISSIYFDNEELELYLGRLEKTEGAEAIRMRWYGDMSVNQIFVERKTHREDWTGEKSVKARFGIKEEQLNDYLTGKITMNEHFETMRQKGKKSDKEIDSLIRLAREVQDRIKQKNLQPCIRTFYNRTAFQQPGDARVRISFDTDLTMIREDNWDGRIRRPDNNWRRRDAGIDFPFDSINEDDKYIFPYGVLEVKLQTQLGQEPPEWVQELVSGPLVEAVPKFSKFIHGCATLMLNRVSLVPFWLPQMEIDIKKNEPVKVIDRPTLSRNPSARPSIKASGKAIDLSRLLEVTPSENASEAVDGNDERLQKLSNNVTESGWAGLPVDAVTEASVVRQENLSREQAITSNQDSSTRPSRSASFEQVENLTEVDVEANDTLPLNKTNAKPEPAYFAKLTPGNLRKILKAKAKMFQKFGNGARLGRGVGGLDVGSDLEDEGPKIVGATAPRSGGVEWIRNFQAPKGKKVAVPVRVEPKVYFATERTFFSWLEFSTILGAIAVTLLNFTPVDDEIGYIASILFTIAALISIIYSTGVYLWRVKKIRTRSASGYYDPYGPNVLCTVLLIAVTINLYLRYSTV
ncbi:hypothetical protein O181_033956 [Austropuccinia psidii MF-1]|uniref:Vacuolar transporter chaperone complex subunit 4 n=1 Tax=Austropuccinia psidii MF-1 TaxID=1389203 RepID=A0A9Q3D5F3_9BASI|nr:hypothetical protein [Austropuccinia psidii MF-1]